MCGIVGYIGEKKCLPILLNGLKKLEYRGYDSAGISIMEKGCIKTFKEKGKVKNLENLMNNNCLLGTSGIAHTRWATHGKPCKENSHPHKDNSGTFSVVHNGIIENCIDLHYFLNNLGYTFYSETDTEVIPNLIYHYYIQGEKTKENLLHSISLALQELKGSYALAILCSDFPELEIIARKDSPLVVGEGINEYYIASDIPAILEYTKDFYFLDDNEIAIMSKKSIQFFDIKLNLHLKKLKHIDSDCASSSKNGYEDFMLKEIFEQPDAIRKTIGDRIKLGKTCYFPELCFSKSFLVSIFKIYIVACGTSMHASLVGKNIIEKLCNIPVNVEIASEFRYSNPIIDKHTLCIFISQSGETADTIAALKLAKGKGCKTLSISNVIDSSITRESDFSLYTYAGPEIAVASTKAYTCQIVLLSMFAIYLAELLKTSSQEILKNLKQELLNIPAKIEMILQKQNKLEEIAKKIYLETDVFFLGRGTDYPVALEGSLKLKEISYIHSEAYPSGELKHGPIALIEDGTLIISALTDPTLLEKCISNLQEVISRGANTFVISNCELQKNFFDFIFTIPNIHLLLSPILSIVPLQLLSYYIAKNKELDVDKPRNLAKSVTVE